MANEEAIIVFQIVATGPPSPVQVQAELLQDTVLASFLLKLPFSEPIPVNVHICSLITDQCELLLAPFQLTTTPNSNFAVIRILL